MNVIDLAEEIGLYSTRTASTNGGEYHSPCPFADCGGEDRFCIWPKQGTNGRYWCRICKRNGDGIQFCRDLLGMSYKEACEKVGVQPKQSFQRQGPVVRNFVPQYSERPSSLWRDLAGAFLSRCQRALWQNEKLTQQLMKERGLTLETAKQFGIGFNDRTSFDNRASWGLDEELREDGKQRKQWLPRGFVTSAYPLQDTVPHQLKIRRSEWFKGDKYPKYVEVSGSQKQYAIYGDRGLPFVVVEAEYDAILLQQEAGSICCSIATGGASKRPDSEVHRLITKAPKVLYSLDFDEAGKKEYAFWKDTYRNVVAWPASLGKSPAEAFFQGINLEEWVQAGVSRSRYF